MVSSVISRKNKRTLNEAKAHPLKDTAEVTKIKKRFPYRGFVDIPLPNGDTFQVFCNNDDLNALAYLWIEGFEDEPFSFDLWMQFCQHADTILDVGSHVGHYSLAAFKANPKASIFAFEAVDYIFARLFVNIMANNAGGRIKAQNVGVSDREGWSKITVRFGPSMLSKGSSMVKEPGQKSTAKWLQTDTLDRMCAGQAVNLMKVDVEGHETAVFLGAEQLIRNNKPAILCEILSRNAGRNGPAELLADFGYSCFHILENERRLVLTEDVSSLERSSGHDRNFFFLHPDSEMFGACRPLLGLS